ncbi:MAG: Asp23/Gls24 family envelope stress response protein [Acidaminococcales bacterium]|jgi:uncharacterized alkaline shock family protein YloU/adenylate kinase family enzyme|nr:Asp23/Gls24 family envelope stress response protein [Acidaminococcales bacterium]
MIILNESNLYRRKGVAVEVVAFVGPAGTGKSYKAQKIARDEGADTIIDDGLLIRDGKIWAGISAKNEQNRIRAVKRAIFNDAGHVKDVREAVIRAKPEKILILGTSEAMVRRIAAKLGVPEPNKVIDIEDVSTKREIARAKESRYKEGKHVVPVPAVELKPHYAGYLIDPFRGFFSKSRHAQEYAAKSIVRPAFSMYGKLLIADSAIADIVKLAAAEIKEIKGVLSVNIKKSEKDNNGGIYIKVETVLLYGSVINEVAAAARRLIKQQVELMTSIDVIAVNVFVRRLAVR